MILMQPVAGERSLGDVQVTAGIIDTAMRATFPEPDDPVLPITSLSKLSTDQQIMDYASVAHLAAQKQAKTTQPPFSQMWAEAMAWYYLAYQAVFERWTDAAGYKAFAITLLKRGDLAAESALASGAPSRSGASAVARVAAKSGAASSGSSAWKWWLAGGIGVVLLGTVVTVVVVRKRKAEPRKGATMHYARRPALAPA